ncbi:hypothetical protein [Rhodococcus sp. AQ5-07]|uniref:hypothetical protein n=1 Tax=Rhodococcus sp. AQ5-07 TaxID=2054902 RepID=UPI000DBF7A1B|nr:hypothetical protein [Rhodococcus sp. AQ5-07]RAL31677.1 hypothetical protein CVN56_26275 [Rhodococcus sp. AQ5-07]
MNKLNRKMTLWTKGMVISAATILAVGTGTVIAAAAPQVPVKPTDSSQISEAPPIPADPAEMEIETTVSTDPEVEATEPADPTDPTVIAPRAGGRNGCTNLDVLGGPQSWSASAYVYECKGFFGHIHIWGPGIDINSPTLGAPYLAVSGRGAGVVCAEAWAHVNGGYQSWGRPCLTVHV